jgi:TolA-binding protein
MAKTPLDRLASLGEEVLDRASQNAAAHRLVQGAMQLKDRVDDLGKRVRGLEQMEKRLTHVEKRLAKLESSAKKSSGASKKTDPAPKPTTETSTAPSEPEA